MEVHRAEMLEKSTGAQMVQLNHWCRWLFSKAQAVFAEIVHMEKGLSEKQCNKGCLMVFSCFRDTLILWIGCCPLLTAAFRVKGLWLGHSTMPRAKVALWPSWESMQRDLDAMGAVCNNNCSFHDGFSGVAVGCCSLGICWPLPQLLACGYNLWRLERQPVSSKVIFQEWAPALAWSWTALITTCSEQGAISMQQLLP